MKTVSKAELLTLLPSQSPAFIEIAPQIYAMRAFSPAEAAIVISQADLSPKWFAAVINAELHVDRGVRDAEILFEEVHRPHADFYRRRLEEITGPLADQVAPASVLREVQLVRYGPGGQYRDHRDGPTPGAPQRVLSLVCYLNDRFGGGGTAFPELDFTVTPATGVVVAFPPAYLHRAEPVESGRKYVLTAWYHALQIA